MNTVHHGTDSIYFFGPTFWNPLSNELTIIGSLKALKSRIKNWKPDNFGTRNRMVSGAINDKFDGW